MNISVIIAIAGMALTIIFFFYLRWYIGKKITAESLVAEQRAELQKLIADLDFFTDRDTQLVEERINTLKKLLEDTDKRIAVYVRELDRSRIGEALYADLGKKIRSVTTVPKPAAPSAAVEQALPFADEASGSEIAIQKTAEKFASLQTEIPGQNVSESPATTSSAATPSAATGEKQLLRVKIAELSAQGLSTSQIASHLKISLSEVDIALSLLKRR
jgi:CCR4-NOT transcriptional regulation complex NOT5 subunit